MLTNPASTFEQTLHAWPHAELRCEKSVTVLGGKKLPFPDFVGRSDCFPA
jgi:hypothetical protein